MTCQYWVQPGYAASRHAHNFVTLNASTSDLDALIEPLKTSEKLAQSALPSLKL
ncbi:hypothetical protein [Phormidesmis priestleyi]